jgi:serine protease AprX
MHLENTFSERLPAARRGAVLLSLALLSGVLAVPATASAGSTPATRVLVTSATGSVTAAADAVRAAGGRVLDTLSLVGGVSAELPAGTVLAPSYRISPDAPLSLTGTSEQPKSQATSARAAVGKGKPAGEGRGVTVAVVDTGVADVADLTGRVDHVDVTGEGPGDGFGHGTFVAGLVAGSGASSGGQYAGIAPAARILDVRVAGDDGATSLVTVLRGLQKVAARPDVDVLNLSLSSGSLLPYQLDPLSAALDTLWRRGVTVVVPAGNGGSTDGIASPGNDPLLLTVGALDDAGTASRDDDTVPSWSGRGPAPQGVVKPDLVAPGRSVVSLRAPSSSIDVAHPDARVGSAYFKATGTSFSTAITSGAVAAMLAQRPSLTPGQVKSALTKTAYRAPGLKDRDAAGAGGLDVTEAVDRNVGSAKDDPVAALPGDAAIWAELLAAIADGDVEAAASSWSRLSTASQNWAASSWSSLSPQMRAWLSMNWAASSWSGPFQASSWSSMNWASINWASMNWASQNWASMNWAASSWSSQNWASMNWASMNWASMNWAASSWSSQNWASQNWASQNWASQSWASQNWASQNWASQNWASQNWG